MWSVRVLSGSQTGQIFDLKLGKNILGRSAACDIKILSVGISKEHCEIHVYKDKAVLVDLKSSNGTFLNGVKIQNSIIKLGDKFSLFDVILDVIPTNELKARPAKVPVVRSAPPVQPSYQPPAVHGAAAMNLQPQHQPMSYPQMQQAPHLNVISGGQTESAPSVIPAEPVLTFKEKAENYVENVVMPLIYKLPVVIPFKQVLLGFVLLLVLCTTFLSVIPLSTIIKESNYVEATKRAKSIARALAKQNEVALSTGQFIALNVNEALKEDGISEALIMQQSDGSIVAPADKAGREISKPYLSQIRKEPRATAAQVDKKTIVASFPIGAPDPNTGELSVRYHAVVYYDVSSLNVDDGRILGLLMQTLLMASVMGGILYFLFARLIQFPLSSLNKQIDIALREKRDRAEVFFDYPAFQQVVANVNLLLNRVMNASSETDGAAPKQNRDMEFSQIVEMLNQPALVISENNSIVAANGYFEQLSQMSKDQFLNQNYNVLTDPALMQNIESLIARSAASPYEKHFDRIPFSQFECEIAVQACLGSTGVVEYYFMTLKQVGAE